MFKDIGGKLKTTAQILFWLELIGSIISGLILLVDCTYDYEIILGLTLIIGGPITAWFSVCALYAFGELIEMVASIKKTVKSIDAKMNRAQTMINLEDVKGKEDKKDLTDFNNYIDAFTK